MHFMIQFECVLGTINVLENESELPDLIGKELFLDVETNAVDSDGLPVRYGNQPYVGDRIAGIAITLDNDPNAYYIPMRHSYKGNLQIDVVQKWLLQGINKLPDWVNHNIKFDAHFLVVEGVLYDGRMIDTLTMAKMFDSDRMSHGLKPLSRDWLKLDMSEEDEIKSFLKGAKTKNYGDVPADIMGRYACMDVLANRQLYRFLQNKLPVGENGHGDVKSLFYNTEVPLTSVLYDIERLGLKVDPAQLIEEKKKCLHKMIKCATSLGEMTGMEFVDSNKHLSQVLLGQLELPTLGYTDTGNPSFGKDELKLYKIHPKVKGNPKAEKIVSMIAEYRSEGHFKGLFLDAYLILADENNLLHSFYNQVVRTGRMSGKNPNPQQLNKRAKELIHPFEGMIFLSFDASQIEFRLIVHFIRDPEAIEAYKNNPKTDFHQWVADLCRIKRSPAKNVNFAMGYGAGKAKVISMLVSNPDVMREVNEELERLNVSDENRTKKYNDLCAIKAEEIYETYHGKLPGIKGVSNQATRTCKRRGYVFNPFGRQRKLPARAAHKAFNSVVQGAAMDYIKTRMIALSQRFNPKMKEWNIHIAANVHDEILFMGPPEHLLNEKVQRYILETLEIQTVPFRVPFTWDGNTSSTDWAEAAGDRLQCLRPIGGITT